MCDPILDVSGQYLYFLWSYNDLSNNVVFGGVTVVGLVVEGVAVVSVIVGGVVVVGVIVAVVAVVGVVVGVW